MSDYICNFEVWNGLSNRIKFEDNYDTKEAWELQHKYRKDALLFAGKHGCKEPVLYYVIQYDEELSRN